MPLRFGLMTMFLASLACAEPAEIILARCHRLALATTGAENVVVARRQAALLGGDGWWPDIPSTAAGRSGWKPFDHMVRLGSLAVLSGAGGGLKGDAVVDAALVQGIATWVRLRPHSDNWWHNEIGVPLHAAQILASRPDLDAASKALLHGMIGRPLDQGLKSSFTGQNLVWRARIALLAAADRHDPAAIARAAGLAFGTVVVTTDEGLQPDGSFRQHGAQYMTGSYGRSWFSDIASLAIMLDGSPWHMPEPRSADLELAILDGLAWTLRGGWLDPSCLGRTISRPTAGSTQSLAHLATGLAELPVPRQAEWAALALALDGRHSTACTGARHLWRAEASYLHRNGFSVGVLAATTRTLRVESINGENLLGALLADGATWIRRRGDEGFVLAPVLDWGRLPGTVSADGTKLKPPTMIVPAESTFGGAVADQHRLVHGWDLRRGALSGHQAWFGVEQGLIALACGVAHPTARVRLSGPVMPMRGEARIDGTPIGTTTVLTAGRAMVHDGLAWLALQGDWNLATPTWRGSWKRINEALDAKEISQRVVCMDYDLGPAPTAGAGGWAVLDAVEDRAPAPEFTVLSNTPAIQAVRDRDGTILAVFRAAGQIGDLSTDGPIIACALPDGSLRVCDPTTGPAAEAGRTTVLTWQGRKHTVALPGGPLHASTMLSR